MTDTIIDAHHHIWELRRIPWLQGPILPRIFGEYSALKRDYLVEEFKRDLAPHGITGSVHVQANVGRGDEVAETAWLQGIAVPGGVTPTRTKSTPRFIPALRAATAWK